MKRRSMLRAELEDLKYISFEVAACASQQEYEAVSMTPAERIRMDQFFYGRRQELEEYAERAAEEIFREAAPIQVVRWRLEKISTIAIKMNSFTSAVSDQVIEYLHFSEMNFCLYSYEERRFIEEFCIVDQVELPAEDVSPWTADMFDSESEPAAAVDPFVPVFALEELSSIAVLGGHVVSSGIQQTLEVLTEEQTFTEALAEIRVRMQSPEYIYFIKEVENYVSAFQLNQRIVSGLRAIIPDFEAPAPPEYVEPSEWYASRPNWRDPDGLDGKTHFETLYESRIAVERMNFSLLMTKCHLFKRHESLIPRYQIVADSICPSDPTFFRVPDKPWLNSEAFPFSLVEALGVEVHGKDSPPVVNVFNEIVPTDSQMELFILLSFFGIPPHITDQIIHYRNVRVQRPRAIAAPHGDGEYFVGSSQHVLELMHIGWAFQESDMIALSHMHSYGDFDIVAMVRQLPSPLVVGCLTAKKRCDYWFIAPPYWPNTDEVICSFSEKAPWSFGEICFLPRVHSMQGGAPAPPIAPHIFNFSYEGGNGFWVQVINKTQNIRAVRFFVAVAGDYHPAESIAKFLRGCGRSDLVTEFSQYCAARGRTYSEVTIMGRRPPLPKSHQQGRKRIAYNFDRMKGMNQKYGDGTIGPPTVTPPLFPFSNENIDLWKKRVGGEEASASRLEWMGIADPAGGSRALGVPVAAVYSKPRPFIPSAYFNKDRVKRSEAEVLAQEKAEADQVMAFYGDDKVGSLNE